MALRVWAPLNGDLRQIGASNAILTNDGATIDNNGKIGKCYAFANTHIIIDSTDVQDFFSSTSQPFSMACWIYLNSDETDRVIIFGNYNANPFINWELAANCTQRLCVGGTSNYTTKGGGSAVPKTTWTHIAVTYDGNNTTFYQNGAQIYTTTGANTLSTKTPSARFYLGSDVRNDVTRLKGKMNDFRLYDHCLSAAEVKEISQGLVLHYKLDGGAIGNPNLLPNSKLDGSWTYPSSSYSDKYSATTTIIPTGTQYVLSFDAKSTVNGDKMRTHYYNPNTTTTCVSSQGIMKTASDGNMDFTLSTNWERYWVIYTQTDTTAAKRVICPRLLSGQGTGTVSVKNIKLEEGTVATGWRAAEETDTIIEDSSGYGHHGSITGNIVSNSNTPRYLASSSFNGTERIVTDSPGADIRTLSCWCKTTKNKSTSQQMVADSFSNMTISFYNGTIIGVFGTTRGTGSKCTLGDSYKENDWNHIVVVKTDDAGARDIYCNGVKLTPTSNDYWSAATGFFVGARNTSNGNPFYGEISDVRAYCTALTADDILTLYHTSAKVDNKQNFHAFELVENNSKIQITKQGQVKCNELQEDTSTKFYKTDQIIETNEIIEL